jgi:hypothetical protein
VPLSAVIPVLNGGPGRNYQRGYFGHDSIIQTMRSIIPDVTITTISHRGNCKMTVKGMTPDQPLAYK